MTDSDWSAVDRAVSEIGRSREAVVPILQAIQAHYRYLPREALQRVCELTDIRPADIVGVSTFYDHFRFEPVGEHLVRVCCGTACHVKGAELIHDAIRDQLQLPPGADTDERRKFTVQKVACLGCCTLAPVVQVGDTAYGFLKPDGVAKMLRDVEESSGRRADTEAPIDAAVLDGQAEIRVGLGSCCVSKGSGNLFENLRAAVEQVGARAVVRRVGCVGMCHRTPLVEVALPGRPPRLYAQVQPEDALPIVRRHFRGQSIARRVRDGVDRLLDRFLGDGEPEPLARYEIDVRDPQVSAFLGRQVHIATEHFGEIDPLDLRQYIDRGGFQALRRCLEELSGEEIIERIGRSGLRGRGGAGFPTGRKWSIVREAPADVKFVICNGDEGDPGAFMDRMILESFPYRVLEGLIIAARAVGAHEGHLYIREEYALAVRRVREAIRQCRAAGILGDRVLGSDFHLDLHIFQGAGAFVCGEETALIASISGQRGMPRLRPPFPAQSGLRGQPTLINNVETLAVVPWIIRSGPERFAALGTEKSKGTKVFSLAGKVERGGLIEVEMGITIREIVEEIGGGVPGGKRLKAVQVGGPSGGCIPAELAETPVDYEALLEVGAMMGSGGLVVLDENDCMVDMARYFLSFTQDQSCGKCSFCRIGTRRMLDILERICAGKGKPQDLVDLEDLARTVASGSICGLGRTAPNPVLTTLRYFRDEYEAHLDGRCPAGRCRELITYSVLDHCTGCTLCARACPVDAIAFRPYEKHEIDNEKCTRCDACRSICPENAILVK
ncbi:MAG: NAD(P)H-dependent oxidoreductase subunit E [Planctomycetes bacterium]|nr:NAD(P)H-dependent oxidoreductase subunit E [Planctomycetota bacterium]